MNTSFWMGLKMNRDKILERLREQYNDGEEIHPHLEAFLMDNPPKRKYESIQWVLDALGNSVIRGI